MCEVRTEAVSKVDRLIESMDRLSRAPMQALNQFVVPDAAAQSANHVNVAENGMPGASGD